MNCCLGSGRISRATARVLIGSPATGLAVVVALGSAAEAQSDVTRIVADQVRSQGYTCENPQSAEHDAAESAPNETVYLLQCEGATYRVVLVPDQGAKVTKVE